MGWPLYREVHASFAETVHWHGNAGESELLDPSWVISQKWEGFWVLFSSIAFPKKQWSFNCPVKLHGGLCWHPIGPAQVSRGPSPLRIRVDESFWCMRSSVYSLIEIFVLGWESFRYHCLKDTSLFVAFQFFIILSHEVQNHKLVILSID